MNWLKEFWCSWTHGGGHIKRDSQDRINWQCQKCGRWADPVPLEQEQKMTNRDIAAHGIKPLKSLRDTTEADFDEAHGIKEKNT